jgi:pimeloyl-ACP methyl ester carboxylesterase
MTGPDIRPFRIDVGDPVLTDLKKRLQNTRLPYQIEGSGWDAGTDTGYLRDLVAYWLHEYDWRKQERLLNELPHYQANIDDIDIHFVHEPGVGPNPFPLILTHGYPDSHYRFAKVIPLLTDPASFGGREEDAFHVVVPDLPGYGFSGRPTKQGTIFQVHDLWDRLMTEKLGYARYGAHGGDMGSSVTEQLARSHPDSVAAIHLTDVPFGHLMKQPSDPSAAEHKYFAHIEKWMSKEGAYALIQSTKPQSLAAALNDSPAGLAAWIIEKFRAWSDCKGRLETRFTKDELLTQVMIYWATASIGTSFQPYFDYANAGAVTWIKEGVKSYVGATKQVPAAFALFPHDIGVPPREFAQRFFNVQRWTEMPRGGHFAAMEEPELFVEDLRDWFRPFRQSLAAARDPHLSVA